MNDPKIVVDTIDHALTSPKAKATYFVGRDSILTHFPSIVEWAYFIQMISDHGVKVLRA